MSNTHDRANCKPADCKTLRNAEPSDLAELMRLLCSQQARAGGLPDIDIRKSERVFEAGIARREYMLVVAPGTRGRLNGFLLIGLAEPWFSSRPRLTELALCLDSGHLRSKSVRELRKIAGWVRNQIGTEKRSGTATDAISLSQNQNCVAEAPAAQPAVEASNVAVQDVSGAIELLQKLAGRQQQAAMSTRDAGANGCPAFTLHDACEAAGSSPMLKNRGEAA